MGMERKPIAITHTDVVAVIESMLDSFPESHRKRVLVIALRYATDFERLNDIHQQCIALERCHRRYQTLLSGE